MQRGCRRAFTLIEILIVVGIIGLLVGMLLPTMEHAREQANNVRCAANLNQIGAALMMYANDNHGAGPRTLYIPGAPLVAGTGAAAIDPFGPGGPAANDTSAPLFLLIREEKLPTAIFADPYTDEIAYTPDPANPATRANFSNLKENLAYSYANPYPDAAAVAAGCRPNAHRDPTFAVAADLNPGTGAGKNSRNHEGDGQNVLYADGHVTWQKHTNCGMAGDEIYVNQANVANASPTNPGDSVLLPVKQP